MSDLRIFSYLPNPRIWKATIAARLCGVEVEVRGASPKELRSWLWDFDARLLSGEELAKADDVRRGKVGFSGTLHKTDAFMMAHPFGAVPAAFSPDGRVASSNRTASCEQWRDSVKAVARFTAATPMKRRVSTASLMRVLYLLAIRRSTCCP